MALAIVLNQSAIICMEVAELSQLLATFPQVRATLLKAFVIFCLEVAKTSRVLAKGCYANVQNLPQESYLGQRGFGTTR